MPLVNVSNCGANKDERLTEAAQDLLESAYELEEKVYRSLNELKGHNDLTIINLIDIEKIESFHDYLIMHIDLVERRLIQKESIPHADKVFSLFEDHTTRLNYRLQDYGWW